LYPRQQKKVFFKQGKVKVTEKNVTATAAAFVAAVVFYAVPTAVDVIVVVNTAVVAVVVVAVPTAVDAVVVVNTAVVAVAVVVVEAVVFATCWTVIGLSEPNPDLSIFLLKQHFLLSDCPSN